MSTADIGVVKRSGFISYSHENYAAFQEIRTHLRSIERNYGVQFWADHRIKAGNYWREEIRQHILAASVFVLLLSPSFFDSDYIFEHELELIREKAKNRDDTVVLATILDRCSYKAFVGQLQVVPTHEGRVRPIREWQPADHGFDASREQIEDTLCCWYGLKPLRSW